MLSRAAYLVTVGLLLMAIAASSGCTLPMKGKLRADMAAPPAGDSVIAIKPTDVYDKTAIDRNELKPLLEAVAKMDRPDSGCWAVTVETTSVDAKNGETRKSITRFDPSKPFDEMFASELVSVNNLPPTESQKNAAEKRMSKYRDNMPKFLDKVRKYRDEAQKKQAAAAAKTAGAGKEPKKEQKESPMLDALKYQIANGSCHMETNGNILKYTILTGRRDNYKHGDGDRYEYLVDMNTTTLAGYNEINIVGTKVYGVIYINEEILDTYETYVLVPGSNKPFPSTSKTVAKTSTRLFGIGGKTNGTETSTFTDYKKVPCHGDLSRAVIKGGSVELVFLFENAETEADKAGNGEPEAGNKDTDVKPE